MYGTYNWKSKLLFLNIFMKNSPHMEIPMLQAAPRKRKEKGRTGQMVLWILLLGDSLGFTLYLRFYFVSWVLLWILILVETLSLLCRITKLGFTLDTDILHGTRRHFGYLYGSWVKISVLLFLSYFG